MVAADGVKLGSGTPPRSVLASFFSSFVFSSSSFVFSSSSSSSPIVDLRSSGGGGGGGTARAAAAALKASNSSLGPGGSPVASSASHTHPGSALAFAAAECTRVYPFGPSGHASWGRSELFTKSFSPRAARIASTTGL